MNQGGEMTRKPAIVSLFDIYVYVEKRIYPDAPQKHFPDEGPHRYILEKVRSLIEGNNVPLKLWTYALSHYLKVHGMVPHGKTELSPD